jgi:hypothetical protein
VNAIEHQTQPILPSILTLAQWQKAELSARQAVKSSLQPPQIETYIDAHVSRYPRKLVAGVVLMLALVILGAFIISAGKQLISYDSILGHLAEHTRLSPLWVAVSLIAGVLLSEVGAVLFSLAGAIFGEGPHRKVFRAFAFMCGFLAILANVAVTASYDYGSPVMTVLAWFMTFFVPSIVLVGALVGERLILEQLDKRSSATVDYEIARREYAAYISIPEKHPDYASYLRRYWLETYRRGLKDSAAILDNPEIVSRLYARDLAFYSPNFTMPPALTAATNQPALQASN